MNRRKFIQASASVAASLAVPGFLLAGEAPLLMPRSSARRVVIVGGGWGGLSAARSLREQAPDLEVVLLERQAIFRSLPLSNKWLVGLIDEKIVPLVHDYRRVASKLAYTYIQTEVSAIDRDKRRVITDQGAIDYDWLILSVGIRYDYSPWFGNDRRAAEEALTRYPCAYMPGKELGQLKEKLDRFTGGELVMTLPPRPYRCPPSPYERALMIGWLLQSRRIKGRLTVLDPSAGMLGFGEIFSDLYRDTIQYIPHAGLKSVDPFNKKLVTEQGDFSFDDAILMPPQQAGDLLWQADLIAKDETGHLTGWANQHPVFLHARDDERIFLIGDQIDKASPLFGHYPKTGHLAAHLGRIAASGIAAQAKGIAPEKALPESLCHVFTRLEPMESTRIETRYRFRGDGEIVQNIRQESDTQSGEVDVQWARGHFSGFLVVGN